MISIVIATYNREKTILRAIYSILNQKFDAYEIVIVDDGSKDNTKQIIENLNNEKIKYFYIENSGAGNAKNYGVMQCSYPYIFTLDSYDELYPDDSILENIAKTLMDGFDIVSYSNIIKIFPNGQTVETMSKVKSMKDYILNYPLNYPGKPPYVVKKSLYLKAGGLNTDEKWGEAILFWRELFLLNPKYKMIDGIAYIYHLEGNDNVSKGCVSKDKRIDMVYNSIFNAYNRLFEKLDKNQKINWEIVLLGISLIRKKNIKFFVNRLLERNKLLCFKGFSYILCKRLKKYL